MLPTRFREEPLIIATLAILAKESYFESVNKFSLRSWAIDLSISGASLLFCFLVLEVGLRGYQRVTQGISFFDSNGTTEYLDGKAAAKGTSIIDVERGWRPKPNYHFNGIEQNADGSTHPLSMSQESHGFRSFGNLKAPRPRILVIGDSYTQAVEVSDDKTYYAILGDKLGAEIFGVGSRGYGTLQQLQTLDQYVEPIKPNLIIWQFCYNDFMSNYFPLEKRWRAGSIGLNRPYLEDESIVYRVPKPYAWLLQLNRGVFRTVPFVTTYLDRFLYRFRDKNKDTLLETILSQGEADKDFAMAVKVTGQLFDRIRKRGDSTPVLLFEACTTAPIFHSTVAQLARDRGFYFVDQLPAALDRARASGRVIDSYDHVHFNEQGHEIIAEVLEHYTRERKL